MGDSGAAECLHFDAGKIPDGSTCMIIGMRGGGKSTVAASLLWHKKHYTHGICLSATEKMNKYWGNYMPEVFLHYEPNPVMTTKLLELQETLDRDEKNLPPPAFAVYDDCLYDTNFMNSKSLAQLFLNGRHFNVFAVFTSQYTKKIPIVIRENTSYVFLMGTNAPRARAQYYDEFGGMFDSQAHFDAYLDACTSDRGCMVIKRIVGPRDTLKDTVFWYAATPSLKYRTGDRSFWDYERVLKGEKSNLLQVVQRDNARGSKYEVVLKYPSAVEQPGSKKKAAAVVEANDDEEEDGEYYLRKQEKTSLLEKYQAKFFKSMTH